MNTQQIAINHVKFKLGSDKVYIVEHTVFFRIPDDFGGKAAIVARHLLSITNEWREDTGRNKRPHYVVNDEGKMINDSNSIN
jgi:hypothetical protein